MDSPQAFGQWLRRRRRELDLTQDTLARQVGCARVTIRKLEAEEIRPSRQLAELLATQLQIPAADREMFIRLGRGSALPQPAALAIQPPAGPHHSLPRPPSRFIGRERQLVDVQQLLAQSTLVTLTGSAGIGKTRLAIEAAQARAEAYPDGVCWVGLAPLREPALVAKTIATAREVSEIPNQALADTLAHHFQAKQLLLVLDNCEHLVLACAQLVDRLLADCPGLRVLATSREALDIEGEVVWQVPSLSVPDRRHALPAEALNQYESVRLFVDRCRQVQPDFQDSAQNLETVAQICQRLSGIPLAIELAAARAKMMSVDEIARRLDDRFELLTAGSRTALPRHQTLRATIDWSFELLSEPERVLFRRLAVFAGGFTLPAAEAILAETTTGRHSAQIEGQPVLALVGQLVNKSLINAQAHPDDAGWTTHYAMLETVREYGRQKLEAAGETSQVQDRHLDYYARLAEQAEPELFSPRQVSWFFRLETEIDNLRAALQHAAAGAEPQAAAWRQEAGLRLVAALVWFFERAYRREAGEHMERLLALPAAGEPTRGRAKALMALGFILWELNRYAEARARLEEALPIFRRLDDALGLVWTLDYLGWVTIAQREFDTARAVLEESTGIAESLGPPGRPGLGTGLVFFGDVLAQQGDEASALLYYQRGIALLAEVGDKNLRALPVRQVGYIALRQGDLDLAQANFTESLALNLEVGNQVGVVAAVVALGQLALRQDQLARAATLAGAVAARLAELNAILFDADAVEYRRLLGLPRAQLPAAEFAAAYTAGQALSWRHTLELALEA